MELIEMKIAKIVRALPGNLRALFARSDLIRAGFLTIDYGDVILITVDKEIYNAVWAKRKVKKIKRIDKLFLKEVLRAYRVVFREYAQQLKSYGALVVEPQNPVRIPPMRIKIA